VVLDEYQELAKAFRQLVEIQQHPSTAKRAQALLQKAYGSIRDAAKALPMLRRNLMDVGTDLSKRFRKLKINHYREVKYSTSRFLSQTSIHGRIL
jgi:hypothetical protein